MKMKLIKTIFLSAILSLLTTAYCVAAVQPVPGGSAGDSVWKNGRVVMVVIDQVSWKDISDKNLSVIRRIIDSGAVGLMTTNPASGGLRTPEHTYTTIGAGAKILGGESSGHGLNVLEEYQNGKAKDTYNRRTGIKPYGEVVNLGIAQMESANQKLKYSFTPGAIGTVLHSYGVKTGVLGNSDVFSELKQDKYKRFAVNIAMDVNGQVDYGEVSSTCLTSDKSFLGGIRSDYDFLLNKVKDIKNKTGFLVIETGDISRLENQSSFTSPEVLRQQKKKALERIDVFLGELLQEFDLSKDLLMIVVPEPSAQSMKNGDFITPFIMAGKDIDQGIIYSGTTRRDGLISNTDIAATLINYFGFPPVLKGAREKKEAAFHGQIIEGIPSTNPTGEIYALSHKVQFMHNTRYSFVKTYINLCLITMAAAVAILMLDIKGVALVKILLTAVTFIPAVFMLADFMTGLSRLTVGLLMGILTLGMVLFSIYISKIMRFSPFLISSGVTIALLIFDIFNGGVLSKTSPLSYDATAGARFYGIGNEYMGVLIGATLTCITLVYEKFRSGGWGTSLLIKLGTALMILVVIYTISAPNLGTNAGGAIAAMSGLGMAGIIIFGRKINIRTIVPIAAITVSVLATFVILDFTRSVETQSHMGRTVGLIQQNGFSEIFNIISRKSEVNLKLIRYTTWSWYFFLSLGVLTLRKRLFPSEIRIWEKKSPWFNKMLPGIVIGCLAALIFNDSGVVSAATMISFGVSPLLWELLQIKERIAQ